MTEAANEAYEADPDSTYDTVSGAAGMDLDATKAMMANFGFPSNAEQARTELARRRRRRRRRKGVADVMVAVRATSTSGWTTIPAFVDPSFLQ